MRAFLATLALVVSFPSATLRLALADILSGKVMLDRRTWVSIATLPDSSMLFFGGGNSEVPFRNFLRLQDGILRTDTMKYPGAGFLNNLLFVRGNYLYAGGGRDSSIAKYSFTDFWRRDLRTNKWEKLRDLPFIYQLYPHPSVGKETLFLVDEVTSWDKHSIYTQQVLMRYRADADAWDSLSQCPKDTRYDCPVYFESDTCIYVLLQSRRGTKTPENRSFYSVSKKDYSWKELAPFPIEGHELSTGYYEKGMGYVCGGGIWGASEDAIFRYDVAQNKWSFDRMGPSMGWFYTWKQGGDWYAGFGCVDGLPITKSRIFKLTGKNASPPTK
jgi:hypothetical protein